MESIVDTSASTNTGSVSSNSGTVGSATLPAFSATQGPMAHDSADLPKPNGPRVVDSPPLDGTTTLPAPDTNPIGSSHSASALGRPSTASRTWSPTHFDRLDEAAASDDDEGRNHSVGSNPHSVGHRTSHDDVIGEQSLLNIVATSHLPELSPVRPGTNQRRKSVATSQGRARTPSLFSSGDPAEHDETPRSGDRPTTSNGPNPNFLGTITGRGHRLDRGDFDPSSDVFDDISGLKKMPKWRRRLKFVVSHKYFEWFVLFAIGLNAISLAAEDPTGESTRRNDIVHILDAVFAYMFVAELLMKLVALGAWQYSFSYFKSPWNWFDFIVIVVTASVKTAELAAGDHTEYGIAALRLFRVLRPVRFVTAAPTLRVLVNSVINSLPYLSDVMLMYLVSLLMFGVFGVYFFEGRLDKRCVRFVTNEVKINETHFQNVTSLYVTDNRYTCTSLDSRWGRRCPYEDRCISVENSYHGLRGFDNIGMSMLTLFVGATFSSWYEIVYQTIDSTSNIATIYHLMVVIICAYYIINLSLVIINYAFMLNVEAENERKDMNEVSLPYNPDRDTSEDDQEGGDATEDQEEMKNSAVVTTSPPSQQTPRVSAASSTNVSETTLIQLDPVRDFDESNNLSTNESGETTKQTSSQVTNNQFVSQGITTDSFAMSVGPNTEASGEQGNGRKRRKHRHHHGSAGRFAMFRHQLRKISRTKAFHIVVTAVIIANMISLMIDHHDAPDDLLEAIETLNFVFTVIFSVESLWKMIGFGLLFFRDGFNVFDLIVVVLSWVDIIFLTNVESGVSALRAFRLLRVIRLTEQFKTLHIWVSTLVKSIKDAWALTFLLTFITFIYALLGMQLFGSNLCEVHPFHPNANLTEINDPKSAYNTRCAGRPRAHFDNPLNAALALFQVLTAEDWHEVMYNSMKGTNPAAAIFFVTYFIIGNYVLLNLFIAVMLSNREQMMFDDDFFTDYVREETDGKKEGESTSTPQDSNLPPSALPPPPKIEESDSRQAIRRQPTLISGFSGSNKQRLAEFAASLMSQSDGSPNNKSEISENGGGTQQPTLDVGGTMEQSVNVDWGKRQRSEHAAQQQQDEPPSLPPARKAQSAGGANANENSTSISNDESLSGSDRPRGGSRGTKSNSIGVQNALNVSRGVFALKQLADQQEEDNDPDRYLAPLEEYSDEDQDDQLDTEEMTLWARLRRNKSSLFVLSHTSRFRRHLLWFVSHPYFEIVSISIIFLSCVALASENPLQPPDHIQSKILRIASYVFTGLFTLEALLKIVAQGFILHKHAYLRDWWNVIDFFCVIVSIIADANVSDIRFLKVLRSLRPLRFIAKSDGMKLVLQSLVNAIPSIGYVGIILTGIIIIFSIMGVQFFKGKFYRCSFTKYGDKNDLYDTKSACLDAGFHWETYGSNFDNLGNAFVALFEVITLEGWVVLMYLGMDARSHEEAPHKNSQWWMSIYFVAFVILGAFFVVNFFMAVLMDMYDKEKRQLDEEFETVKKEKLIWLGFHDVAIHSVKKLSHIKRVGETRMYLRRFALSNLFAGLMLLVVALNCAAVACEHNDITKEQTQIIDNIHLVCQCIFALELVIMLMAMNPGGYLISHPNKFELMITVCCWVGVGLNYGLGRSDNVTHMFKMVAMCRLFRFLRLVEGVRTLLATLLLSLQSIAHVAGLVLLQLFFFSVLGMNLFARVNDGEQIGRRANFRNIRETGLLLTRIINGEAWDGVRRDCAVQVPFCDPHLGNCGTPWLSSVYFIIFMATGMYILLNLFVAVIVNSFWDANSGAGRALTEYHMDQFNKEWLRLDPETDGLINTTDIHELLTNVGAPLGYDISETSKQRRLFWWTVGRHLNEVIGYKDEQFPISRIHYFDLVPILIELSFPTHRYELPEAEEEKLYVSWFNSFPTPYDDPVEIIERPMSETFAAILLQRVWRATLKRRKEKSNNTEHLSVDTFGDPMGVSMMDNFRRATYNNLQQSLANPLAADRRTASDRQREMERERAMARAQAQGASQATNTTIGSPVNPDASLNFMGASVMRHNRFQMAKDANDKTRHSSSNLLQSGGGAQNPLSGPSSD